MWYVAHVIRLKFRDGLQNEFRVFENLLLIEAASFETAKVEAARIGRASEDLDGTTMCDERPVDVLFAGIRKIVMCENPDFRPDHGIELSYNELTVKNENDLLRLVEGEEVGVVLGRVFQEGEK